MKKLLITIASLLVLMAPVAVCATVSAQGSDPGNPLGDACSQGKDTDKNSAACKTAKAPAGNDNPIYGQNGIIIKGAQVIALLTGAASIIVIIISGFRYVVSMGDPSSVEASRNAILYALIGLVIAATAEIIVAFVVKKL